MTIIKNNIRCVVRMFHLAVERIDSRAFPAAIKQPGDANIAG
jgi:hypothetical protein